MGTGFRNISGEIYCLTFPWSNGACFSVYLTTKAKFNRSSYCTTLALPSWSLMILVSSLCQIERIGQFNRARNQLLAVHIRTNVRFACLCFEGKVTALSSGSIPAARVPKREFARRLEILWLTWNENREPFSSTKVKQPRIYKICFLVFIWILYVIEEWFRIDFFFKIWVTTNHPRTRTKSRNDIRRRTADVHILTVRVTECFFHVRKSCFYSKIYFIFIVLNLETNV